MRSNASKSIAPKRGRLIRKDPNKKSTCARTGGLDRRTHADLSDEVGSALQTSSWCSSTHRQQKVFQVNQVNPYTVDMSKGVLCNNGLEMNHQYLVSDIYFVFHANCTAPGFDPHTGRLKLADNPDLCTCALVIGVILVFMYFGCGSSHEYHRRFSIDIASFLSYLRHTRGRMCTAVV